jgi:hypothetical protein
VGDIEGDLEGDIEGDIGGDIEGDVEGDIDGEGKNIQRRKKEVELELEKGIKRA